MKICTSCNLSKTIDNFGSNNYSKDKLNYVCNSCRAQYEKNRRISIGIVPTPVPKVPDCEHKECLDCKNIKHIDDYPNSSRGRLGKGSYCRACVKERCRENRSNPNYKESARIATQKYRDKNREHWRSLHRINQFNRKNACKAVSDGTVTSKFMQELYATPICCWCKKEIPINERTAEHVIPLVRGGVHSASNLKMACLSCNSSKINFK